MYNTEKLRQGLSLFGISYTEEMIEQLLVYYEMLVEKNKVMNLTAITEFDEVVEKHFLDSASIHQYIDMSEDYTVLDMGTGAGFPGIPLKILFPNLKIYLLDSLNKRVNFLNEVIIKLKLHDIEAFHGRAEDYAGNPKFRGNVDMCVSRAVANLSTLSEYCLPFVKKGGQFVSYKSGNCAEEVEQSKKAIKILGGEIEKEYKFQLGESNRAFVVIRKVKDTPKQYPRKAGTPSKNPL